MGNKSSKGKNKNKLPSKALKALTATTNFKKEEIKLLWDHFCMISQSGNKDLLIDLKEFKQAVGFRGSEYVSRMFQLFDADADGTIDFNEFVKALSTLSDRGTFDEKLALSFLIYDADGDGRISRVELSDIFKACLTENSLKMSDKQIDGCVNFTFKNLKTADTNFITQDEYNTFVKASHEAHGHHLLSQMSFNVGKRIEALQAMKKHRVK
jgi:Ca2+-binding EF-hand superfamily protein